MSFNEEQPGSLVAELVTKVQLVNLYVPTDWLPEANSEHVHFAPDLNKNVKLNAVPKLPPVKSNTAPLEVDVQALNKSLAVGGVVLLPHENKNNTMSIERYFVI